ncbi:ribosomal protein S18-alanine N-acetyltransferase [Microbacterium candidum]|uniref:Ribosomal protein S18-alanine N-acetyltransferase n=1 Tax=Microbacterium candidum TaxID=3041922 RepID=A0ABT7MXA0_9MICO|nr:ribosomal protein S18-alanine N-acetyltransferase [Microbacterium sp. ASV49]MDL9979083.1 ribosomal protein S18-alanine N-acetyltransferase [Microbacterium sp. ASV49]
MTRAATADDLGAIMALERASFPTDAWSEAMMREELASPHNTYVVAEQAGRIVGYGGVRAPRRAKDADIQTIAIDAAARGRGRGRALLRDLLNAAQERGAAEVFLEVRADNPVAQALYESEGFAEMGRRPRYYQPDDVDAVVMRLDLRAWAHAATADGGVCT